MTSREVGALTGDAARYHLRNDQFSVALRPTGRAPGPGVTVCAILVYVVC